MSVEDRIIEHRIVTLGRRLSSASKTYRRNQVILEIVRFCVTALESATGDEAKKRIREVIDEALNSQNEEGRRLISNRIRLQIIFNVDLQLVEIEIPEECLDDLTEETKKKSVESDGWIPDFMKSLTEPLEIDKR